VFREIDDAVNMVVIDVTDHEQIDSQRLSTFRMASLLNLFEPVLQVLAVNTSRSTVDQHHVRFVFSAVMQDEAITLAGRNDVQTKDHVRLHSQID
jgi:hypothetical protein